jgi:hypothetical protein
VPFAVDTASNSCLSLHDSGAKTITAFIMGSSRALEIEQNTRRLFNDFNELREIFKVSFFSRKIDK